MDEMTTQNMALVTVPQLAFNTFLKIDGVKGESTTDSHKDWIEILSYSHKVTRSK